MPLLSSRLMLTRHVCTPCRARPDVQRKDWLGLVAVHSDAWLLSLAFYKGARLEKEGRCAARAGGVAGGWMDWWGGRKHFFVGRATRARS